MKPLINLSLRTEFSFKQAYGSVHDLVEKMEGAPAIGVADINNTFAHVYLEKLAKEKGFKPIYGVRLEVVKDPAKDRAEKRRGVCGPRHIFIAKNADGFHEMNDLVGKAWLNFYYKPMIGWVDVAKLSENVFIIPEGIETEDDYRIDYLAVTPSSCNLYLDLNYPKVYCNDNFFPKPEDRKIYQLLAGHQKRGDEYMYKFETKRAFQHILTSEEFYRLFTYESAIENSYNIADQCDVKIPKAAMVKYKGRENIIDICKRGAEQKKINLEYGVYADRFKREIDLIIKKDYVDYFMNVWQMIYKAKKTMFVGPARGSAAGSLVCYLMSITEVDPIRFDLVFERFIDLNREDLPDIDVDFPDDRRPEVIKDLFKMHGKDNVCHISNISTFKAKSAIDTVGIALRIPKFEIDLLKDSVVDRSGGDARAKVSIQDTLETTEIGKQFAEEYPTIKYAEYIQGHASHASKHAAGIIVCNDEVTRYGAYNYREGSIMMDKKNAEYLNLLKIDALGLRTLTVLQECASLIGMDYHDYYTLPLDDKKTYKMFAEMRLHGIFQFEGQAMRMLCSQMGVEHFDDIVAITALARPGPLHSGGADKFVRRRTGIEEVEYISHHPEFIEATKETYGIIVYQEQLMNLCRRCGNMSWEDVSEIRKAASKTYGKEFFDQYCDKFMKGAEENNIDKTEAEEMWSNMMTFGCLSGDTILKLPASNQYSPKRITIKELYENGGYAKPAEEKNNAIQQEKRGFSKLWMYDFEKEAAFPTQHFGVIQSGEKETFLLRTKLEEIRATKEHKFLTKEGWKTLGELNIGDEIYMLGRGISKQRRTDRQSKHNDPDELWRFNKRKPYDGRSTKFEINRNALIKESNNCRDCGSRWEETHHIDGTRDNDEKENLTLLCRKCHKERHKKMDRGLPYPHMNGRKIKLREIKFIGDPKIEMTYDIMMPDPNNNFEANNFIVHNSWGMNKSHTVSYGYISYWCAYMKANHPLEFFVANLRNSKSESATIKILRDAYENEGIDYIPVDPDTSEMDWSVSDGKLVGGLQSIKGVAEKKAKEILLCREGKKKWTPSLMRILLNPKTPHDTIYPCWDAWHDLYENPREYGLAYPPSFINDLKSAGTYVVIGRIIRKDVRDLNEYNELMKRGGKVYHKNNKSFKLTIEDDTGQINCSVNRFKFDKLKCGELSDSLQVDESWVIVRGAMSEGWRVIQIDNIFDLKQL